MDLEFLELENVVPCALDTFHFSRNHISVGEWLEWLACGQL
jgi:hypothetical protein